MLRIDETAKTLVAPEPAHLATEAGPARDELLALVASGWGAFAAEIGEPQLRFAATAPEPGVDVLALDEAAARLVVVSIATGLEGALAGAAAVSRWDGERLAAQDLGTAVPGDSPRLMLVAADFDSPTLATLDWLVRRHGLEAAAHRVAMLRLGSERLLQVSRAYPAADAAAASAAAGFIAALAAAPGPAPAPVHSAPPPGVPAA